MSLFQLLDPRVMLTLARTFGPEGLVRRTGHEFRARFDRYRAEPRDPVPAVGPPSGAFGLDLDRIAAATDRAAALARAERVAGGEHEAFRSEWRALPQGAGWLTHPATGRAADGRAPWWRVRLLDPAFGDIKDVWEPARFGWVYDLIRGYAVGRDDRFVAAFARVLADWDANNPPFRGPGWACGQETSIRAIAIRYAEAAFAGAPGWSAETQQIVNRILWWSGERVNDGIGYALSQRNNHGLSEAVGLLALGDRFRSAVPVAADWFRRGRALAHRLVGEQFASDGWYIQHSFTYARLAADQAVIADRILRSAGEPGLDPAARQRLAAFGRLIAAVIDPASGEVPNHGASDGAFVHPITLGGYRDFRPILTAVTAITGERLRADVTADDEVLSWLGAAPPPRCPPPTVAVESGPSGWAVARGGPALVFVRAGQYRTRPGHVDPLQVDVRWEGRELIVDAGTYSYNGGRGWRNALSGAAVHNTPIVDDRPPGLKGPRFLWYRWPDARLGSVATDPPRITAEIPGRVRRTVTVTDAAVTIEDEVLSPRWRRARCVWLLHPDADPALVHGADRVVGATEDDPAGWFSPRYAVRIPSRYLLTERSGPGPFFQRIVIGQATGSEM